MRNDDLRMQLEERGLELVTLHQRCLQLEKERADLIMQHADEYNKRQDQEVAARKWAAACDRLEASYQALLQEPLPVVAHDYYAVPGGEEFCPTLCLNKETLQNLSMLNDENKEEVAKNVVAAVIASATEIAKKEKGATADAKALWADVNALLNALENA